MSANEPNVTKLPKNFNRTESEQKKKNNNKKQSIFHYFTHDQIVFFMFSNNQNNSIWYSWTLKSKFLKVVFLTAMWNRGLWSKNTLAWMEMLTVKDTTQIEYKYFQPSHFIFFFFFLTMLY